MLFQAVHHLTYIQAPEVFHVEHVFLSADRKTAWFDEIAESKELGASRGTGVLMLERGKWKVAQYNLSIPVPNEKFEAVRKIIAVPAGSAASPGT